MLFSNETISESWVSLVRKCYADGSSIKDESEKLIELLGVYFTISNPEKRGTFDDYFDTDMLSKMKNNFLTLVPQFGYKVSYGERIWGINGDGPYFKILDLLKRKSEAKSATISLVREADLSLGHVPCITTIDFKIRNDRLHLHYMARSQDGFKKNYADNSALFVIQKRLADELGIDTGSISGYISSLHIYESDITKMKSFKIFTHLERNQFISA